MSPDTRIAIAELEKRAAAVNTPEAQADLGVAYLVQGDIDRAITTIEDAAQQLNSPAPWSDLSAAYLAQADRQPERRIENLARALDAAERSLRIAPTNEAAFNRALAGDGLSPYTGADNSWQEYLTIERDAAWLDAARREAMNDRPPDDVRDRWEARRRELVDKARANDAAFIKETVQLFPEAAVEFLENEILTVADSIVPARLTATAIHDAIGDPMPRDEVAAIAKSGGTAVRAHQAYAEGVALYDKNNLAGARQAFTRAHADFARVNAPYESWASIQLASIDFQERDTVSAERRLIDAERIARRHGYTTLLGRTLWLRGLVHARQWRLSEALAAYRDSAAQFERTGQHEYAVSLYHHLADALRTVGETHESWAYVGRTLEQLPRVRKPLRRYLFLYNASLFASREQLHETALVFQNATVRAAEAAGGDVWIEAAIQRALVHVRRNDLPRARADADAADERLAAIPEGAFKSYVAAELEIVRAQLSHTAATNEGLRGAIAFFERIEPGRVPALYLLLARTSLGRDRSTAEQALQTGIARLEQSQAGLGDEALRISYFDDSWALFQDMVTFQQQAKNPARAFEFAERSRARSLLAAAQGATLSRTRGLGEIQQMLPPSVLLAHYTTLPDRVLLWTISRGHARLHDVRVGERDLARLVTQHRRAINEARESAPTNDRLYELLIAPVLGAVESSSVIVLVPDAQLQQLPFATLRHPSTGRYLIEDHTLMMTPSASFFVDAEARNGSRTQGAFTSALLVGNPNAAGTRALPGAEVEVAKASQLYARRTVLTGRGATKARFLELAPSNDVIHFGGHAFVNAEFPLLSRLVFADERGAEQSLFAHEISRVRFPRTRVVVLAACSTAAGVVSRGEGVVSVARPFLGGGVPAVIASQWDVDDRATEQLTLAFHRALTSSGDPIKALRTAQLEMLRSGDSVNARPGNWGAFIAVGSTAPSAVN